MANHRRMNTKTKTMGEIPTYVPMRQCRRLIYLDGGFFSGKLTPKLINLRHWYIGWDFFLLFLQCGINTLCLSVSLPMSVCLSVYIKIQHIFTHLHTIQHRHFPFSSLSPPISLKYLRQLAPVHLELGKWIFDKKTYNFLSTPSISAVG